MRMETMVKWLENEGFVTKKEYDSCRKKYIFTIKKGDKFCTAEFEFPQTPDSEARHSAQCRFLYRLVDLWNQAHGDRDGYPRCDGYRAYAIADEMVTHKLADRMSLTIKNVIFNDPATIVFWQDGSKTVVKCQDGDKFDPEKGLAMAIAKKVYGNKGNYCNQLKKWLPKEEFVEIPKDIPIHVDPFSLSGLSDLIAEKMFEALSGAKKPKEPQKKRMTFREEVAKLDPHRINDYFTGGVLGCPRDQNDGICTSPGLPGDKCRKCWDREIPEELMRDDI